MPQYTDSEFWDKFVIAYISIRLILLACISILIIPQVYYEYREIYKKKLRQMGPKFITLIALTLFPIFRIIDQLSYLFTIPRSGTGSWAWFFGVIGTYFLFLEWMYIGCFWIQLIYTYFVSESINLKNSRRCWITCLVLATLLALWDIGLLIGGMINPASADKFYRVGFIVTLILLGLSILGHGIILAYHLKTQKSRIPGLDHVIKRILQLSCILGAIIVLIVCRDIVWSIFKLPHSSPYRHITIFLTAVCEIAQSLVVMLALTDSSLANYFAFKRVSHETRVGNIQNKKNGSPIDREFSSNSSVVSSSSSSPEKIKHAAEVGNLANEINFEILDSGTIDREDIEET